jgi:hypothetical protein
MASGRKEQQIPTEAGGGADRLGQPLLMVATFAAGVAAALGTKALLDSRRKGSSQEKGSDEDLPTVLRRAGLDVVIAATNQAAERLGQDRSEPQNEQPALQRS